MWWYGEEFVEASSHESQGLYTPEEAVKEARHRAASSTSFTSPSKSGTTPRAGRMCDVRSAVLKLK